MGPLLFAFRRMWLNMPWVSVPTGVSLYAAFIGFWEWLGDQLLKTQNGKLRYYLVGITGVVAVLMLLGGYENLRPIRVDITSSADLLKIMLLLLAVGSTIGAIVLRKHLLAALAMGVMGYAVGGLFLLEPAPDVALVQFLVETTATVLIILMIARISASQRREVIANLWRGAGGSRFGLWRDAVISLAIGVSVGLFALAAVNDREARLATVEEVEVTSAVLQLPAPPAPDEQVSDITRPITLWHLENAYPLTGVTDVVSAILADFRATDTLIEISVFGMAALGVFTLLTMPQGRELLVGQRVTQETRTVAPMTSDTQNDELLDEKPPEHASQIRDFDEISETLSVSRLSTPLTRLAAVLVLPFALLISAASVLYGGIGPGDGFTAGVVGGLGVSLWYVVFGYFEARARLQWVRPGRLIAFGLLLALTNAAMGLLLADGFFNIFKLGDGSGPASLHLASTLIFELSIFLTVFGGVTMIMSAIAHPRNVEQAL
ncbi:MAG: hydrogen gas-evolving membrane-bound hydrogenase subunit E, partial [Chloroflexota bacterium]